VKADNILIGDGGTAKLADVGVAAIGCAVADVRGHTTVAACHGANVRWQHHPPYQLPGAAYGWLSCCVACSCGPTVTLNFSFCRVFACCVLHQAPAACRASQQHAGHACQLHWVSTNTFTVAGDLRFVDPEALQTNIFSRRSDVYSFGLVLAQLLDRPCGAPRPPPAVEDGLRAICQYCTFPRKQDRPYMPWVANALYQYQKWFN
jgi:serine/threonine protein kinase